MSQAELVAGKLAAYLAKTLKPPSGALGAHALGRTHSYSKQVASLSSSGLACLPVSMYKRANQRADDTKWKRA